MEINSTVPLPFGIAGSVVGFAAPSTAALAVTIFVVAAYGIIAQHEWKKYPPGPSKLAAGTALIFNGKRILMYMKKWRQRFGAVYSLCIGRNRTVTLTDYDIIHDAFVRHADVCSLRPKGHGRLGNGADSGVVNSPHYKEQRRFALAVLREQGMGKIDMEFKILEEIRPFIEEIEKRIEEPLDLDNHIYRAVANIIYNLVLGSRFEYSDPVFLSLLDRSRSLVKLFRKISAIDAMPLLKWLPGDIFGYHRYMQNIERNKSYFREAISRHKESLDPQHPRDFIDAYLLEIKAQEGTASAEASSFNEANCVSTVIQLFVAGTDTTSTTLLWAWLFMMLHIDVQKKVQSEIDVIIGSRHPSLKDKAQMPFTEAVLTEVMRLSSIAVVTLPHRTEEPVNLGGHVLPPDTTVIASVSDVHLDEQTYPEPMTFKPERFIGTDGTFEKPKKFIPFGLGRRACIGESLARAELFLFFTGVLQKFDLTAPIGSDYKPEGECMLVHKPLPYKVVFKRRHLN